MQEPHDIENNIVSDDTTNSKKSWTSRAEAHAQFNFGSELRCQHVQTHLTMNNVMDYINGFRITSRQLTYVS